MPVKPQPFTLVCQQCGWKIHCAPKSDVIMPKEIPDKCAKCGSDKLHVEHSGFLEVFQRWVNRLSN